MLFRDEWRKGPYTGGNKMLIVTRRRLLYPSYVQDYLDRVTAADRAAGDLSGLELAVTDAFSTTLQALVSDGLLGVSDGVIAQAASQVKASPIIAGARTLPGALTPVVGPAPTRVGTEAGWNYNRKLGLKGNGTNNYLNSNRAANADAAASCHLSVNMTELATVGVGLIGNDDAAVANSGEEAIYRNSANFTGRSKTASAFTSSIPVATGFTGINRADLSSLTIVAGGTSQLITYSGFATNTHSKNIAVFARDLLGTSVANPRLSFYSIGGNINLSLLRSRIQTLMASLAAAIP
jgi:hypothetical protein